LLCLTGLSYFLYQHYRFSWPLVQVSPRGVAALAAYELGYYRQAAGLWRTASGLTYDPATLPQLLEQLEAAVTSAPGNLMNYLWLADVHVARGEYSRAAHVYEQALEWNPEFVDATIGLAAMRLLQGAYPEARQLLEPVFDRAVVERYLPTLLNFLVALDAVVHAAGPADAERDLTLAYAYRYLAIFDARQYASVIRYAARALQRDPAQDAAHFCAGVAYMKQGVMERAIEHFQSALRINLRNAEAYKRLAYLYGERGRPDLELRYYRHAVDAAPETPRYAYALGLVLQDKFGDLPQAVAAFRQAHALQPTRYAYTTALAHALEEFGDHEEALVLLEGLAGRHPDVAEVAYFRAKTLVSLHRYGEAVVVLETARAAGPLPAWVVRELTFAYSELNRREAGIAAAEEYVQREPQDVHALYDLQSQYRRVGRYADAYRVVQQILTLQPEHAGALRVLPYLERNLPR
jgi:tetratricopeptide (TPR) repeat protein